MMRRRYVMQYDTRAAAWRERCLHASLRGAVIAILLLMLLIFDVASHYAAMMRQLQILHITIADAAADYAEDITPLPKRYFATHFTLTLRRLRCSYHIVILRYATDYATAAA